MESLKAALVATAKHAEGSIGKGSSSVMSAYGSTLRDMAEALAWVRSPSQPHGGGMSSRG